MPRLFLIESEHDLAVVCAELTWTRRLRDEIADGALPGLEQWRDFHCTGQGAGRAHRTGLSGWCFRPALTPRWQFVKYLLTNEVPRRFPGAVPVTPLTGQLPGCVTLLVS